MFIVTIIKDFCKIVEQIPFEKLLNSIRIGLYAHLIKPIRHKVKNGDQKGADNDKRKLLAFTPAGRFEGGRKSENLVTYSHLIVLDFDKLDDEAVIPLKTRICRCEYTLACFISPSGRGLKVFVCVSTGPHEHRTTFIALQQYYQVLTGFKIDPSGKDIARLCFVSFDDRLYYNPGATIFTPVTTTDTNQTDFAPGEGALPMGTLSDENAAAKRRGDDAGPTSEGRQTGAGSNCAGHQSDKGSTRSESQSDKGFTRSERKSDADSTRSGNQNAIPDPKLQHHHDAGSAERTINPDAGPTESAFNPENSKTSMGRQNGAGSTSGGRQTDADYNRSERQSDTVFTPSESQSDKGFTRSERKFDADSIRSGNQNDAPDLELQHHPNAGSTERAINPDAGPTESAFNPENSKTSMGRPSGADFTLEGRQNVAGSTSAGRQTDAGSNRSERQSDADPAQSESRSNRDFNRSESKSDVDSTPSGNQNATPDPKLPHHPDAGPASEGRETGAGFTESAFNPENSKTSMGRQNGAGSTSGGRQNGTGSTSEGRQTDADSNWADYQSDKGFTRSESQSNKDLSRSESKSDADSIRSGNQNATPDPRLQHHPDAGPVQSGNQSENQDVPKAISIDPETGEIHRQADGNNASALLSKSINDTYKNCILKVSRKYIFMEGQRNEFVFNLALQMRQKGLAEATTLLLLLRDYNFNEKEVRNCVKSAYSYNWIYEDIYEKDTGNKKRSDDQNRYDKTVMNQPDKAKPPRTGKNITKRIPVMMPPAAYTDYLPVEDAAQKPTAPHPTAYRGEAVRDNPYDETGDEPDRNPAVARAEMDDPDDECDSDPSDYTTERNKRKKKIASRRYVMEEVERLLTSWYETRYNEVTGLVEWRKAKTHDPFVCLLDYHENTMFRDLHHADQLIPLKTLHTLLNSSFSPDFNPFTDYLNHLPPWDGVTDYIGQLSDTVKTKDDAYWKFCFRKWFVAYTASLYDDDTINHTVIVFVGEQGIGKTSWMKLLLPPELRKYLGTSAMHIDTKDTSIQLTECGLVIFDEMETLNKMSLAALKELLTRPVIHIRRPYGRNFEDLPRRASFISSVNFEQVLTDPSGTRRYLCSYTTAIDYQHKVDIGGAMAQALALYKSGFKFWFNQEEIKELNCHNEDFISKSIEEEVIETWFRPVTRAEWDNRNQYVNGHNIQLMTTTEVANKVLEKAHINLVDNTIVKIGKIMVKLGYKRIRKKGNYAYMLRMLDAENVERSRHTIEEDDTEDGSPLIADAGGQGTGMDDELPF